MKNKIQVGDELEKVIIKFAPRLAQRAKDYGCNCENRKQTLNKIGERFQKTTK